MTWVILIDRIQYFQETLFTKHYHNGKKNWNKHHGCTSQQLENHANHAQDYQSPLWQKTMKNDVWYVWVYHPKNAKACKIMKYGHAKSCKPCTRPALLWLAQKIMENDVWYVWVYLQKTAKSCKMVMKNHANHAQD